MSTTPSATTKAPPAAVVIFGASGDLTRRLLLPSALTGAVLLLGSDIAARLVHTNPELRLGVFTSLLGTPFFFWLVVRIRKVAP